MPRLDVLLARNLGWSRGDARAAVDAGEVTAVGGGALPAARAEVPPSALPLTVVVDGAEVTLWDSYHVMLHKPLGCVTALRDQRYPTAYALLRDAPLFDELRPVGRLDLDTSGLLLFTTDGPWLQRLTHPKRAVPRTYQAVLAEPFRPPAGEVVLDDGHRPAIQRLAPLPRAALHPALAAAPPGEACAEITIIGGAYHEVRRIFAALGSNVVALCRVGFGRLALPADLPPGSYRSIGSGDV